MSTPYHAVYFSHEISRRGGAGVERLSRSLFDACVDLNPHQIEAALFAVRSPVSQGVLLADEVGRWWIKDAEIDVIGINEDDNAILFGEVKWSEKPVGVNILSELKSNAEKVQWGNSRTSRHFALFSRKGFTNDMLKMAEKEKVLLFKGIDKVR